MKDDKIRSASVQVWGLLLFAVGLVLPGRALAEFATQTVFSTRGGNGFISSISGMSLAANPSGVGGTPGFAAGFAVVHSFTADVRGSYIAVREGNAWVIENRLSSGEDPAPAVTFNPNSGLPVFIPLTSLVLTRNASSNYTTNNPCVSMGSPVPAFLPGSASMAVVHSFNTPSSRPGPGYKISLYTNGAWTTVSDVIPNARDLAAGQTEIGWLPVGGGHRLAIVHRGDHPDGYSSHYAEHDGGGDYSTGWTEPGQTLYVPVGVRDCCGSFPSLAFLNRNGTYRPVVSCYADSPDYYGRFASGSVLYREFNGTSWSLTFVDMGGRPHMAVNPRTRQPSIAYVASGAVRLAEYNGSTWTSRVVAAFSEEYGIYGLRAGYDAVGNLGVLWIQTRPTTYPGGDQYSDNTSELKFAYEAVPPPEGTLIMIQ